MHYTNRHNLSAEFVHWLKTDDYDYNFNPNVISATTIMKPTRMVILEERWKNEASIDVSDLIASRYGTALHDSFEKADIPNTLQEVRFYRKLDGIEISGKIDMLINVDKVKPTLADIKSTSVWNYILGSKDDIYKQQLSIYKWILEDAWYKNDVNKQTVKMETTDYAEIKYVFTDWSKKDSIIRKGYPQTRVLEKKLKLYSTEETEEFLRKRIAEIKEARNLHDNTLPECSKEDLWQSDTVYAVMKQGGKASIKNYDDYHSAIKHAKSMKKPDYFVETREGKVKRCNYCIIKDFCNQYKNLLSKNLID